LQTQTLLQTLQGKEANPAYENMVERTKTLMLNNSDIILNDTDKFYFWNLVDLKFGVNAELVREKSKQWIAKRSSTYKKI